MNKAITAVVVILVIIAGVYFFTRDAGPRDTVNPSPTITPTPSISPISGTGKVIIEITDKAAEMTTVSEVEMTVSKVEVHSQTKGWITVSRKSNRYNLLALKSSGQLQFAGEASVTSGIYDEVKLSIDKVVIKTNDGAQKIARLPGKVFAVRTSAVVNGGQTSSIKVDIKADKSLHMTTTGEYVFAPTAEVEARSDTTASVDSSNMVTLTGGQVMSTTKAGMDLDGSVKADFQLDTNAVIKLEGGTLKLDLTGSVGN